MSQCRDDSRSHLFFYDFPVPCRKASAALPGLHREVNESKAAYLRYAEVALLEKGARASLSVYDTAVCFTTLLHTAVPSPRSGGTNDMWCPAL